MFSSVCLVYNLLVPISCPFSVSGTWGNPPGATLSPSKPVIGEQTFSYVEFVSSGETARQVTLAGRTIVSHCMLPGQKSSNKKCPYTPFWWMCNLPWPLWGRDNSSRSHVSAQPVLEGVRVVFGARNQINWTHFLRCDFDACDRAYNTLKLFRLNTSDLQLDYHCSVRHKKCRRILKHVLASYDML